MASAKKLILVIGATGVQRMKIILMKCLGQRSMAHVLHGQSLHLPKTLWVILTKTRLIEVSMLFKARYYENLPGPM